MREVNIGANSAGLIFCDNAGVESSIISLSSKRYWKRTEVYLEPGKEYCITASGCVNTGSNFTPDYIEKDLGQKEYSAIKLDYLTSKIDFCIGLRDPTGSLLHPEYEDEVNSDNDLVQELSDSLRVMPKENYGCLIGCIAPDMKTAIDIKENPWQNKNRIFYIGSELQIAVSKGTECSCEVIDDGLLSVTVDSKRQNLYLVINDCVIPELGFLYTVDSDATEDEIRRMKTINFEKLYSFVQTKEYDEKLVDYRNAGNNLESAISVFSLSLRADGQLVDLKNKVSKQTAGNYYLGPRDFVYLNNQGHYTVFI